MQEHRPDSPALDLAKEVASSLRHYFGDRVTALGISNVINDRDHVEFSVLFEAYSFFPVIFNYDRGSRSSGSESPTSTWTPRGGKPFRAPPPRDCIRLTPPLQAVAVSSAACSLGESHCPAPTPPRPVTAP